MEKRHRNKIVLSSSGITPLRRFLEYDAKLFKGMLDKKLSFETVQWNSDVSLDDFKSSGYFIIHGFRTPSNSSMPMSNWGRERDFVARLVVNHIADADGGESMVGQILMLSDSMSGDTKIYTRSCITASQSEEWSPWQVMQGAVELGGCDNVDSCVASGIYNGTLLDGERTLTFVLTVINNCVAETSVGVKSSISQLMYAVDLNGNVFLKQRSRCEDDDCWRVWRDIISEEYPGSIDIADFEKHIYSNSTAIVAETTRATEAEEQLNEKISLLDNLVLRLNRKNFPLTVKLSHTPSTVIPQEYTGGEYEFTLSWQCTVDGVALSADDIESVTVSYNGKTVSLPVGATSSVVKLADTATVTVSIAAQGMNATANTKISFGRRWFSGVVNNNFVITADGVKSLGSQGVAAGKGGSLTYPSFSLKKIVYAYAACYGNLSAIIDANNINLINNYTLSTAVIDGVEYNIYMTTEEFSVTGSITYKFQ